MHGRKFFGNRISVLENQLLAIYHKDHSIYYDGLENLVLHLHLHYGMQYEKYGSLNYTNCFGQENLLGAFAKNKHGTRYWGALFVHYFNVSYSSYSYDFLNTFLTFR